MLTKREDIKVDVLRSAFTGYKMTDNVKRAMVVYAERELKWDHSVAMRLVDKLWHELQRERDHFNFVNNYQPSTEIEDLSDRQFREISSSAEEQVKSAMKR